MIDGIHHATLLATDARQVIAFATQILGLHLVKRTVADDDPGVARLIFGDASGSPGTLLSFFVAPGFQVGQPGRGQAIQTILSVPEGSLDLWRQNLAEAGIETREGSGKTLFFPGPDGVGMGVIANGDDDEARSLHGVVLASADPPTTRAFLVRALGFQESAGGYLYAGDDPLRNLVLLHPGGQRLPEGTLGAGTIHHVAFRVAGIAQLDAAQVALERLGWEVERGDQGYFQTLSLREPGGVLLVLATDGPGLTRDEPAGALGRRLCLPRRFEPYRTAIEDAIGPDASGAGTAAADAQP